MSNKIISIFAVILLLAFSIFVYGDYGQWTRPPGGNQTTINNNYNNTYINGSNSSYWNRTAPYTFLANPDDNVGLGSISPPVKLYIEDGTFFVNSTTGGYAPNEEGTYCFFHPEKKAFRCGQVPIYNTGAWNSSNIGVNSNVFGIGKATGDGCTVFGGGPKSRILCSAAGGFMSVASSSTFVPAYFQNSAEGGFMSVAALGFFGIPKVNMTGGGSIKNGYYLPFGGTMYSHNYGGADFENGYLIVGSTSPNTNISTGDKAIGAYGSGNNQIWYAVNNPPAYSDIDFHVDGYSNRVVTYADKSSEVIVDGIMNDLFAINSSIIADRAGLFGSNCNNTDDQSYKWCWDGEITADFRDDRVIFDKPVMIGNQTGIYNLTVMGDNGGITAYFEKGIIVNDTLLGSYFNKSDNALAWHKNIDDITEGIVNKSTLGECEFKEIISIPIFENVTRYQCREHLIYIEYYNGTIYNLLNNFSYTRYETIYNSDYNVTVVSYFDNKCRWNTENEITGYKYETVIKQSVKCTLGKNTRGIQQYANIMMPINDETLEFNNTVIADNYYTNSLTPNKDIKYIDEFDKELLDDKNTHPSMEVVEGKQRLNVEDRIVRLEGAISQINYCSDNSNSWDEYKKCLQGTDYNEIAIR